MDDLSYKDPPVEVVATSPRLEMIMSRLGANQLRPRLAPEDFLQSPLPLLVDTQSVSAHLLKALQLALANGLTRPVILLGNKDSAIPGTMALREDGDLSTLASRLAAQRRKNLRDREVLLRRETAMELGVVDETTTSAELPKLLYLGDGTAYFLALQSALRAEGIDVTAALSIHTALDYLRQQSFSSILVDLSHGADHAVKLLGACNDREAASNLPIFACLRDSADLTADERTALSLATEIIDAETEQLTASKIARLAHSQAAISASSSFKPDTSWLRPKLRDRSTGVYSRKFLQSYLARQFVAVDSTETDLAILALRLKSARDFDEAAHTALPDLARLIQPLLRETDCAARLDQTALVICLPDTSYSGAVRLAERIVTALGGDNLGAEDTPLPFGGSLTWRAIERRRYHTVEAILGAAAASGPFTRTQVA